MSYFCAAFKHNKLVPCTSLAVSGVAIADSPLSKQGYKLFNSYVDNVK